MATLVVFTIVTYIWAKVLSTSSFLGYAGSNATLECGLNYFNYVSWSGPEKIDGVPIDYNYQGFSTFSSRLNTKRERLLWNPNKRDIIILDLKITDTGSYQCKYNTNISSLQLYVRVKPSLPEILNAEKQSSRLIVPGTEDRTVTLMCISRGGYPAPYLDWYLKNVDLSKNITTARNKSEENDLTITMTALSTFIANRSLDRNEFICQSSFDQPAEPLSSSVVLYLSLKPSKPVVSGNLTVVEQSQTTLNCTSQNARPEGNISWSLEGNPVTSNFDNVYDYDSETYTIISSYTTRKLARSDNGGTAACEVGHKALDLPLIMKAKLNVLFAPDMVNISGNKVVVANGSNKLTLKCRTSSSNPISNITWTVSGPPPTTTSKEINGQNNGKILEEEFTFTPRRDMDGNAVSCTAEHYLLQSEMWPTQQVNLDLKYSPKVTITDASSKTVTEGGIDITFHCSAESKPQSNFTWYRSETLLISSSGAQASNEFDYIIATANRSHYGEYKCCASNEVGSACGKMVRLHILFPPLDVQILGNKIIAANGTNKLNLTCETGSANPVATVVLKIGSHEYTQGDIFDREGHYGGTIRNYMITLTPTRHMDGLKIQCKANNNVGSNEAVKEGELNIDYGPITTILDDNPKIVVEGQTDISMTCSAESKPPSRFKWYKAAMSEPLINGTGTLSSNTLSYTVATVNRIHAGNYRCTAENGITNANNSDGEIQLIVQYPPDVTVTTVNATINDQYVDIHCTAAGVPSNYTFSKWRQTWPGHNGDVRDQLVSTNKSSSSERTLRLTNLSYQDTGIYTCGAGNGVNSRMMNGSSYLLVKSNPVLANISKTYKVPAGLNTQFRIVIAVYSNDGNITAKMVSNDTGEYVNASITIVDEPVVKLQVHGDEVNTNGYSLAMSYVILRDGAFGNYTLHIANDFGTTVVLLEVFAEAKPFSPSNLAITESTAYSVTLSWIRGFHGGRQQTFVIQYSTDGLKWTNGTAVEGGTSTSQNPLNTTIEFLQPDTLYYFMLFAYNDLGRSENTTVLNITTKAQDNGFVSEPNIGLIAGAVGGLIAAVIVIVVVVLIFRRHKKSQGSPKKALLKGNDRSNKADNQDDLPEINLNPMYESAEPSTSKTSDVYAEVRKQKPKQQAVYLENTDVYAEVQKPKNKTSTSDKQKKKEENKQKKDKQTKSKKGKEGMVYENTGTFKQESEPKKSDTVYENPLCLTEDEKPNRIKNEDGLIYVMVELAQQKGMGDRKPVIHGLEDRTDYADIQFGKVGEPAPESDEEDNLKTNKK